LSWLSAVLITWNLLAAASVLQYYTGLPVAWALIFGTAAWAAQDARSTQPWRYQTGLANRPTAIFVGVVFLWIIVLPWYLVVRGQIRRGKLALKAEATAPSSEP
jgi:hypothetical protein